MKNAGKLVGSMLGILLSVEFSAATPNFAAKAFFPNATSMADNPDITSHVIPCFPFKNPHCCIDYVVCECKNGTFFATNKHHGASSLCNPPGSLVYGNNISSIPGSCC